MRVAQGVLTLSAIAILGIASSSAQTPAGSPLPTKVFASAQDVAALIVKAKRDRKPGQAAVLEPMLSITPYRENLEYRAAVGPAAVHVHEDEFFYMIEGSGTFVTGGKLVHPVQTNPENFTGDSIVGGSAVAVKQGDFFVVPEKCPALVQPHRWPDHRHVFARARIQGALSLRCAIATKDDREGRDPLGCPVLRCALAFTRKTPCALANLSQSPSLP